LSTVSFTRGATYHGPCEANARAACERSPWALGVKSTGLTLDAAPSWIAFYIMGKIAHNLWNNYDASPLTDERVEIEEEI
jgi:hypothetical protein